MKEKILFIVNPISGTGKQKQLSTALENHLNKDKFDYKVCFTEYQGHASILASDAIDNYSIVVAVGGDGTVNEVAKGLANSKCVMGILPVGSGNGLARHLKLSMRISEAIKTINACKVINIDMGSINEQSFVNVAGIGFDAHIAHMYASTIKRGAIPYAKLMTNEFSKYKPDNYKVFIEGQAHHLCAFLISFANSSQFGNNAYISPHANINDGLIDVCMMSAFPVVEAGQLALKLFNRRLDKTKYMKIVRGTNIVVEANHEIKGHIDGEPVVFSNKIEVKVNPDALRIIYNPVKNKLQLPNFKELLNV